MRLRKPSDLARIVKTQRQAQNLTQQQIADAVGVTRQSVARIEQGHGGVSFETVLRIFDALDIELDAPLSSARSHPTSATKNETSPRATHSARDKIRSIDASGLAAAIANLNTSGITDAALRNINTSGLAAAIANINTSGITTWQDGLDALTGQLQESLTRTGTDLSDSAARRAILRAAIEAGDPDAKNSGTVQKRGPLETSKAEADG